ncbi:MAG: hypothetical protein U1E51_26085 [Candidatus Binatia bacterium]|nr:hypothetical protein [Candidatus Binatia bacterium]
MESRTDDLHAAAMKVVDRWYQHDSVLASEMLDLERAVDAYSDALQWEDEGIE